MHRNCGKVKWPLTSQDYALKSNQKSRITAARARSYTIPAGALVIVISMIAAAPSIAQQVPLPRPAPKARDNLRVSAAANSRLTTGSTQTTPPDPIIPDPHRNVPTNIFATFDANQKAEAARVSSYLSSLQSLVGNFVQVGPDGTKTKGDFYIQKPGKVRFEYDPPSPIDIIADGSSVAVRDRNLATQDIYPLSQTPLRFLLSDHVNLMKDTKLVAVYADDVFITAVIEEKTGVVGTSKLMIMFSAKDMALKQWTVTDPQGYDTTVAVYNLATTKKPDPSLFKIDFTKYPTAPG